MSFRITNKSKKSRARIGQLKTLHGVIQTPFFMPIATRAAVKNLTSEELKKLGAEIILSNTYHLFLKPGEKIIKKIGGLHQFMNWSRPILTDSGGFQVFSLAKMRKIKDDGIEFMSEIDGKKVFLTPKKAIQIQLDLGSDILMSLDECIGWPCKKIEAERAIQRTSHWAKLCKSEFESFLNQKSKIKNKKHKLKIKRPLLFGIIQGGTYKNLREKLARETISLDFDGYAIGGLAVGEPEEKMWQILEYLMPLLPENKPRYLMGLGKPEQIVKAIKMGIDMFDCVIPTREARHGKFYKFQIPSTKSQIPRPSAGIPVAKGDLGTNPKSQILNSKQFYEEINIRNAKYQKDFKPINGNCLCYTCQNYSRAYLRHLFLTQEPLALRLATIHNLKFYLDLIKIVRQAIRENNL